MNNNPEQPFSQEQPSQYAQPQYGEQPPTQYAQPQWNQQPLPPYAQPQYGQAPVPPYAQPQYGQIPAYAQPQPNANNFLARWLMMGIAVRIVLLIVIPLLLCGGCALIALLSSLH
ncbi:MAG TPA: hypothetical protein VKY19_30205 [Ktedonosporobacter sp.]|jgi:hypothetical protein|nr:hypothetical protein [Ktedonosporobacter sp.]